MRFGADNWILEQIFDLFAMYVKEYLGLNPCNFRYLYLMITS